MQGNGTLTISYFTLDCDIEKTDTVLALSGTEIHCTEISDI